MSGRADWADALAYAVPCFALPVAYKMRAALQIADCQQSTETPCNTTKRLPAVPPLTCPVLIWMHLRISDRLYGLLSLLQHTGSGYTRKLPGQCRSMGDLFDPRDPKPKLACLLAFPAAARVKDTAGSKTNKLRWSQVEKSQYKGDQGMASGQYCLHQNLSSPRLVQRRR